NMLFMQVMESNRMALAHAKDRRSVSAETKAAMDHTHLALQNLNYEQLHFIREIAKADGFETIYQDLPLHSVEEFLQLAPPEWTDPSSVQDEHQLMLNRLRFELAERKRLYQVLVAHRADKETLQAENKALSDELDQIDRDLRDFLKSSVPIQAKLGISPTKDRAMSEKSQFLPPPLFTLYKQFSGYILAHGQSPLRSDNASAAGRRNPRDDGPSGSARDASSKAHGANAIDAAEVARMYQPHALRVIFTITDVASLIFSFLPVLGIVIVTTELASTLDYLPASFLASGLIAGDDGTTSPNPANHFLGGGSFSFDTAAAGGFAFYWAQSIAGLHFPAPSERSASGADTRLLAQDDADGVSGSQSKIPSLKRVVEQMLARHRTLVDINAMLAVLCTSRISLPAAISAPMPQHSVSSLQRSKIDSEQLVFTLTLEVTGRSYTLEITLPAAYPEVRCTFKIVKDHSRQQPQQQQQQQQQKPPSDDLADTQALSHIEQVEAAINEGSPAILATQFADYSPKSYIVCALSRLVYCLAQYGKVKDLDASPDVPYASVLASIGEQ
ncbi:Fms-interacting protein-domain-containing protein, partial [Entophlyctis helioformis]